MSKYLMLSEKVRVVLVKTSHSGNIGAAARAMKTMGLSQMVLVNPKTFPSEEATARSSGAEDILENAKVVSSLFEAIADCQYAIATSARSRSLPWPVLSPKGMGDLLTSKLTTSPSSQIALVFGGEKSGLSNDELQQCQYHVQIPTSETYSSLNLAAAVQILCYEARQALEIAEPVVINDIFPKQESTQQEMAYFFQHLETVLHEIKFIDPKQPKMLMSRLRRLFNRAGLDPQELNILRGILSAVQKECKPNDKKTTSTH